MKNGTNKNHPNSFFRPVQTNSLLYLFLLAIAGFLLQACSNTKFLAEDEKLYTRTWFSETGFGKINNKPLKAYELYLVGDVKTNRPFMGLPRTSLTIHNYCKPTGKWGPRHYIYKVFQKPPVLLSQVNPEFRMKVMKQRLSDMGHFDSDISMDLKIYGRDNRKARARYHIYFKEAYTIRNLDFYSKHTKADSIVGSTMSGSLVRQGEDYWLKVLEDERSRLSRILKDEGYYFFNPDFLLFHADTGVGQKQVDLTLVIKDEIPKKAYNPYSIRNINVFAATDRARTMEQVPGDSVYINEVYYKSIGEPYRPQAITRPISLKPGKLYTETDHDNTLRYLQGMQAFRSVTLSFTEVDSNNNLLDAHINLVPRKPIQTSLEMNFAGKSNDFIGPAAILSVGHMNIFKGAEQLTLQLDGGFEWQRRSRARQFELGFNSYEIGSQLKLTIPRFLVPFSVDGQSRRYVPKTYASVGFRTIKRVKYYSMDISQLKYGYNWRTSPKREYKIEPVSIDYLHMTETSEEFDKFLLQYPQIALSFEQQYILGSVFSYTYTTSPERKKLNQLYYNGTLDVAGNLLNAFYQISGLAQPDSLLPQKLFGVAYSQYTKLTNDLRYYIFFTEKKQIATRLLAGVGVPYGNSTVLPYVKQFFAGGSHDLRAFYARSLGPGSYSPPDSVQQGFLDQSGEIKLLANIEYRFPITYKTYGAFFVDAGNVWLINKDDSRPGGQFKFGSFMDEVAIGSGIGLRVDIDYFVIRLDAAIPIRKPYLSGSEQWIFNNTGFFKDYILSLAVGYPF